MLGGALFVRKNDDLVSVFFMMVGFRGIWAFLIGGKQGAVKRETFLAKAINPKMDW
jgi:uncharacterized membrane protein YuzA (DUF378 family)